MCLIVFFFKQKTAYVLRISDWSSDVCSSDLAQEGTRLPADEPMSGRRVPSCAGTHTLATASIRATMAGSGRMESLVGRSEERRGGKECVSPWRSGWQP